MSHRIGVVAHTARSDAAHALQEQVGAVYLTMDNDTLGSSANHRKAWTYLATKDSTFALVLEDDAIPVEGFLDQLEQALTVAPTPIVSLYLGTGYPIHYQPCIDLARHNANNANACWLRSTHLLHAVGVAIRTDLLPSMLEEAPHGVPIDEAITRWAQTHGHEVGYTWPSIIQHDDTPSVIRKHADGVERTQPRKAWWCHTRTEWTDRSVTL